MYLVRNREYHPTLGRLTTRDPGGYVDGPNLVQYVRGSPIDSTDPLGLTRLTSDLQRQVLNKVLSEISRHGEMVWSPPESAIRNGINPNPLKQRAAWFVGEGFSNEGLTGAILDPSIDTALAGLKAIAKMVPWLDKAITAYEKGKEVVELAKEINEQLQQFHRILMRTEGSKCLSLQPYSTNCNREILILYDTRDDTLAGVIQGTVGDYVGSTGKTSCCHPEGFTYTFKGTASVAWHGWWIFGYWNVDSVTLRSF